MANFNFRKAEKKDDSPSRVDNLHANGFDFESVCRGTICQFQF